MMMKRTICILPLLALVMLCSCGVRSTDTGKTPEKDVEVATGSAITAVFKNSETTEKTDPWENDFFGIYGDDNGYNDMFLANLDGTEKQELKTEEDDCEILWLTNDWMYYVCDVSYDEDDEVDRGTICRIPVDCEAQTKLDWEHKEILVKDTCYPDDFMVTDSYIFYCGYDTETDSDVGYRYDFNTQENTLVFEMKDDYCEIADAGATDMPFVVGDNFFLVGIDSLYAVSLDTLEYKAIATFVDEEMDESILTEYEGVLYFTGGGSDSIYKYDGDTTSCLTTETAFHKAVKGMDLTDKDASGVSPWIEDISIMDDRLYVTVEVDWESEEKYVEGPHKGETVQQSHERHVLLSTDINDCSEWKLDDTLAEYMLNNFERDMYAYDICGSKKHKYTYKTDAKDTVALRDIEGMFFTDDKGQVRTCIIENNVAVYYHYDIATGKMQKSDAGIDY